MRWVACFVGVLTLAASCVLEDKPVTPEDGGVEAGMCGVCPTTEPICNDDFECVQCTADNDAYCTERSQVCDTESSTCVECLGDSECTAADASRCDGNQCKPCDDNTQCSDIEGLLGNPNACDDGLCVDCTPETEADTCLDGKSCNPASRECTKTDVGSLDVCEACVADSECGEDGTPSEAYRCVPMTYQGERFPDEETGFCLKSIDLGGSCTNPYRIVINRTSLSGAEADDYCGINESLATCQAVRALLADVPCDPMNGDQDCPQPAGLCRELPGMLNRCTYLCSSVVECMNPPAPGSTCDSSGPGGDDYCGG